MYSSFNKIFVCIRQQIKKSTQTEVIDGKKYYIHTVEKGQTLYAIAKIYEVDKNDIILENPEAINGLALKYVTLASSTRYSLSPTWTK